MEMSWKEERALSVDKLGDREEGGGLISISAAFNHCFPIEIEFLHSYQVTHYQYTLLFSSLTSLSRQQPSPCAAALAAA